MTRKALVFTLLLSAGLVPQQSLADGLEVGAGMSRLTAEAGNQGVRFNTLQGSVGYKFGSGQGFFLTPEIRFGTGIKEDSVLGTNVELDHFQGVNLRAGFDVGKAYIFLYPSYTKYQATASAGGISVSGNEWDRGLGAGFGFNFSEKSAIEITHESIEDIDALGITFRLRF